MTDNITKKFETINTNIETQVTNVKKFNEVVKENSNINSETNTVISSINENFQKLKTKVETNLNREKENKERLAKENNVCIFNVPESLETNQDQAKKDDVKKLHSILDDHITLEKSDIKQIYRKSILDKNKTRPIIITLTTKEKRAELLNLRGLKFDKINDLNEVENTSYIYISKDRTRSEQEQNKKLVMELKDRRKKGENIYIRNGKIIEFQPFRGDAQLSWA